MTPSIPARGPFHPGELAAQQLAGGGSPGGAIRDAMPDQHRRFFAALPFVVVATTDTGWPVGTGDASDAREPAVRADAGSPIARADADSSTARADDSWPVATVWTGEPGFVTSPDARTLQIAVALDPADPASHAFTTGAPFGLLGIELATRRRNRANGTITDDAGGLVVAIHQSFGNCPKYIHPRELIPAPPTGSPPAGVPAELLHHLDQAATAAITAADTFFIATAARTDQPSGGVDISHRGGPPGFIRVDGDTLTVPDYPGNRYFNTLGNLLVSPRAALLFVDFTRGDVLHLQGATEIRWDGPDVRALPGAERLWRFRVARAWRRPGAVPLRWRTTG